MNSTHFNFSLIVVVVIIERERELKRIGEKIDEIIANKLKRNADLDTKSVCTRTQKKGERAALEFLLIFLYPLKWLAFSGIKVTKTSRSK